MPPCLGLRGTQRLYPRYFSPEQLGSEGARKDGGVNELMALPQLGTGKENQLTAHEVMRCQ